MKKKLLALVLVLAMLLSCMLMLTSCPGEDDPGTGGGGGETPPPAGDGELNLDEGVDGGKGSTDVTVITDPNNPGAGAGSEDKYIRG